VSRVPAEFQGKARVFRDRIVAADTVVVDVSKRIEKMVNDRYRLSRSLKLRPEMLIDIARDWKTRIPAFGRINLKTTPGKASLRIDETRVMQSVGGYESWNGETELGVVVERISLNIEGESTQLTRTPPAIVNLHTLARRFMRAFEVTHEDVLKDLGYLAKEAPPESVGIRFGVVAPEAHWKGQSAHCKMYGREFVVFLVRTFAWR
jgi:hypothetical protein